ncbi:hypothetical protein [Maribellus sediminis]|uniref:hypothetical protein n=1 Tax=Maribellus sediminis TaxID=2696285 RepID=UPI001431C7D1|nr:hypothetical protein [Maribellus sediminis]
MITIQKIGKLFILFVVAAGLASCGDDTETAAFTGVGDVMVIKRKLQDETRYARSYAAYANHPMTSAVVSLPEGGTLTLESELGNKQTYYQEPSIGDFSVQVPELGLFDFTVVNEDIEHVFNENAAYNDLDFVSIDTVSVNNGTVHIEWQLISEAGAYRVRMVDENYDQIFSGDLLGKNNKIYEFLPTQAETGKTYKIEVFAFSFEAGSADDPLRNIEEISISSTEIVW